MAKYVRATFVNIFLRNYRHGTPNFRLDIPYDYTVSDLIEIVKICTGYSNKYGWEIFVFNNYLDKFDMETLQPIHDKKAKKIPFKTYFENKTIDEVTLAEIREARSKLNNSLGTPLELNYGPIIIHTYQDIRRSRKGITKVYPDVYNRTGVFPTEEEFIKNVRIEGNGTKNGIHERESVVDIIGKEFKKSELKEYDEKLKECFKGKYKKSDEPDKDSGYEDMFKLIRIE
jgi:hypothetical protein